MLPQDTRMNKEVVIKMNRSKKAVSQLESDSTDWKKGQEKQSKSSDCRNWEASQVAPTEPQEVSGDGTKSLWK